MKKTIKIFSSIWIIFTSLLIVGCNNNSDNAPLEEEHSHLFSKEYSYDESNHWIECSCGEKKSVEKHNMIDNRCNCGFIIGTDGLVYEEMEQWDDKESYVKVVGVGTATDKDIVISSFYNGKRVVLIEDEAFNSYKIESVVIPSTITCIGTKAFGGCKDFSKVFYEGTIEGWCDIDFFDLSCNPMHYANHFYLRNGNNEWEEVTSVEIPDTITEIGEYQFSGFSNLYSVVIPKGVETIKKGAFTGCCNLTSITLPDSVISIEENAFSRCYRLMEVNNLSQLNIVKGDENNGSIGFFAKTINSSVSESSLIEKNNYVFARENNNYFLIGYKGNESEIILPQNINDNNYDINTCAFYKNTNLKSIIISNGVRTIGERAFLYCKNLESITIPKSVNRIEEYAFRGSSYTGEGVESATTNLKTVYYEGTIEDWCKISFDSAYSNPMSFAKHFYLRNSNNEWEEVTSIEIPNTITKIGDYQFFGFNNVDFITIPNSVTTIGGNAFSDCTRITNIIIPKSVTTIGNNAFSDCYRLVEVYNLSSVNIQKNDFNFNFVEVIHTSLEEKSIIILAYDFLFVKNKNNKYELLRYDGENKEISIPNNVNGQYYEIHTGAFYACDDLTSVTLNNSVTHIKSDTFAECINLKSLEFHSEITSIEENAFYNCINLTSINLPSTVSTIGDSAFYNCYNLTSINLPSTVSTIGDSAFYNCYNFKDVIIPIEVYTIGDSAFSGCYDLTLFCEISSRPITWKGYSMLSTPVYWYSETKPTEEGNYWHYVDGVVTKW